MLFKGFSVLAPFVVASEVHTFGPQHCVSVSRSPDTGSCVLQTNCASLKLDTVEFAFTCKTPGRLQKHSFGKGGFDQVETFDTSVKCDICGLPSEVTASLNRAKQQQQASSSGNVNKQANFLKPQPPKETINILGTSRRRDEPAEESDEDVATTDATETVTTTQPAVSYGPQNCIETWLASDSATTTTTTTTTTVAGSPPVEGEPVAPTVTDGEAGVCYVKTNCAHVDTTVFQNYPVGVIASDKNGVPVRHLFGANSFDKEEEFNTLIRATACYGMDETAEAVSLENEIKALSKVIYGVKKDVDELKGEVGEASSMLVKEHTQYKKLSDEKEKEKVETRQIRREARNRRRDDDDDDLPDDFGGRNRRYDEDDE